MSCEETLTAADPALETLQVPDEVCAHFKDLGDYDYRPTGEVTDADDNTTVHSVIDVDIPHPPATSGLALCCAKQKPSVAS